MGGRRRRSLGLGGGEAPEVNVARKYSSGWERCLETIVYKRAA